MGVGSTVVVGETNGGACEDPTQESPPVDLGVLCSEGEANFNDGVGQCSEESSPLCFG